MKLTYNDGTDLQIQSASIQGDGTLLIKTVSATEDDLRAMFGDELKTRKMVISERSQTVGEYEGYTTLEGITKYTAGITGIILSKPGETVAEKMDAPGRVGVSVSGTLGETVITTDIKSFTLPATLSGGTPSDPEPTVWQQILNKVDETQQIAQSVRDDAWDLYLC